MDAERAWGFTGGGAGFFAGAFWLYWLIAPVSVVESICGLSFLSTYDFTGAGAGFLVGRAVVGGLDMFDLISEDDYKGIIVQRVLIQQQVWLDRVEILERGTK